MDDVRRTKADRARRRREAEEMLDLSGLPYAAQEDELAGVALEPREDVDAAESLEDAELDVGWEEMAGHVSHDLLLRRRAIVKQLTSILERAKRSSTAPALLATRDALLGLGEELRTGGIRRVKAGETARLGVRAAQIRAIGVAIASMQKRVLATGLPGAADDLACLVDLYRDLGGSVTGMELEGQFSAACAPSIM